MDQDSRVSLDPDSRRVAAVSLHAAKVACDACVDFPFLRHGCGLRDGRRPAPRSYSFSNRSIVAVPMN